MILMRCRGIVVFLVCAALVTLAAVAQKTASKSSNTGAASSRNTAKAGGKEQTVDATVVAAGDIADCDALSGAEATAKLIDNIPGTVLAIGDLSYPDGSELNFKCYEKTWGRHKARTRPAPGNHEHHTAGASGYFNYFGTAAGTPAVPYYSFDLGAWHIISLDSECPQVGGCEAGSPEERWLRQDLERNTSACILAFWHIPLFSSGDKHGNAPQMKPFWDDLYAAGADIILGGHDHDYERFALQTPDGKPDAQRGIREFVVGTGGKSQRGFSAALPTTERRSNSTFGVLRLTLHPTGYDWKFVAAPGSDFFDSGSDHCHGTTRKAGGSAVPSSR